MVNFQVAILPPQSVMVANFCVVMDFDISTQNISRLIYFTCLVYSVMSYAIRISNHVCASGAQGHRLLHLHNVLGDDMIQTYKFYKQQMSITLLVDQDG